MVAESRHLHLPSTAGVLPKSWRWERLDEVCIGVFDCPHSTPILTDAGPYVVRSQDVRSGIFRMKEAGRVSDETYQNRIARAEPRHGDLVYSREGTYFGNAAEVPPDVQVCLGQRMVLLRANEHKANFRFLRYWLNSPVMARHIHGQRDGTVAERLNMPTIRALPVALPPLPDQHTIGSVLGALDDKIELNRRMNETLEALAQTIFKSWFVDATATKLPKGWRAGTLGEVAENPRRSIQPDEIKSSMSYIGLEHMPRRSIALSDWESDTKLGSNKLEFKRGEILFGKLRPYFHKVGIAPLDGVCSTDILVVRPKTPEWFGFVLGHVSSVELVNHTDAASTGTKMPRTNWNDLARFEVALPPESLAAEFTDLIRPMIDRIIANIHESRTLAEFRDALLPKLLSGELRVPVALKEMPVHA